MSGPKITHKTVMQQTSYVFLVSRHFQGKGRGKVFGFGAVELKLRGPLIWQEIYVGRTAAVEVKLPAVFLETHPL